MNVSDSSMNTTTTSSRRMSGLMSGLDTDTLVKQLTMGTQNKIDKQVQARQLTSWKRTAYREIISKMTAFKNKYFSYSSSSSNILSKNFFNVSSIASSSKLVKASGNTTAAQSMRISKVNQIATQARFNSSHRISGSNPSLKTGYIQENWRETDIGGEKVVVEIDGVRYTGTIDGDISLPTVGENFRDATGTVRTATIDDVNEAVAKAMNESLKSMVYVNGKQQKATADVSGKVGFSYDAATKKFSITGGTDTATHKVTLAGYEQEEDGTQRATTSEKLLYGTGMIANSNQEYNISSDPTTSVEGLQSVTSASIDRFYSHSVAAGSYIKLQFGDGTERTLHIASDIDLTDGSKFSKTMQEALQDAIVGEGLEDDLKVTVTDSGITLSATGMDSNLSKFVITGGSSNLIDGLGLSGKVVSSPTASDYSTNVTSSIINYTKLYGHNLGDSLAGTTLSVKLNGQSKSITFDESDKALYSSAADLQTYLQGKLASAFGDVTYVKKDPATGRSSTVVVSGTPKINVGLTADGGLELTTNEVQTDERGNAMLTDDTGKTVNVNGHYVNAQGRLTDDMGAEVTEKGFYVTRDANDNITGYTDANGAAVDADGNLLTGGAGTAVSSANLISSDMTSPTAIITQNNSSEIEFSSSDSGKVLGSGGALRVQAGESNRVATNQSLNDIADKIGLKQLQNPDGSDSGKYGLNINGKNFVFEGTTTLAAAISKINSDTEANVKVGYSSTTDSMYVIAKDYGAQEQLNVQEYQSDGTYTAGDSNMASKLFGQNGVDYHIIQGEDAQIEMSFDDGHTWQTITRSSNSFEIDGVGIELTGITNSDSKDENGVAISRDNPIKFTVSNDTDELFDKLKEFVEGYNEIVKLIHDGVTESKERDPVYPPLTDAQREEMTEDQIKNWEEKAKKGILSGETVLKTTLSDLRMAMNGIVNSSGFKGLSKIGIATKAYDWDSGGILEINEEQLRKSIAQDPDAIAELFTNPTDGLSVKLKNVFEKNVGTLGGDGVLLAHAGSENSLSDQSALSTKLTEIEKQIKKLKKQLKTEQDRYYNQFTYMEKLLSQLNAQSGWLMQQSA